MGWLKERCPIICVIKFESDVLHCNQIQEAEYGWEPELDLPRGEVQVEGKKAVADIGKEVS